MIEYVFILKHQTIVVKIIFDDIFNVEIERKYDLIFIDASKGNNINFFNKYSKNLGSYGIIITDNLLFHGLVRDEGLIETKNYFASSKIISEMKTFTRVIALPVIS